MTARAKTDYVLAAGATTSSSGTFKATPFAVTPAAVTFTDKDGTKDDVYVVLRRLVLSIWSVGKLSLLARTRERER